jgi:O-antigen/teichoic acid export membrane protein
MSALLRRFNEWFSRDGISKPALLLVAGRTVGFAMAFAIPVVLARRFDRAAFGTYKQLFLIYATLYGLAQLGAAESLYYFVPRAAAQAGKRVANAIVTLVLTGVVCLAVLVVARERIANWLSNTALGEYVPLLGVFLALTLVSAAFEIVMVCRREERTAAATYAGSDLVRTAVFVAPALAFGTLRAVLVGAVIFAAARVTAMLVYFWREFGAEFRVDLALWRDQLAYALPFALAVGIEVVQANFHQWVVATRFDAATFAIYAVGCLQIPLVDLVCTSTCNVMMVKMANAGPDGERTALTLWHDTTARLASLMFPLAAFLLVASHSIIVILFTSAYAASVPVFMVWCLMVLPSAFAVDGVLRAYAQTRFLLVMNIVRLALVAGLIGWFIGRFSLVGAVLVTLAATTIVKTAALARIARLWKVGFATVLPWKRLALVAAQAAVAAVPAWLVVRAAARPPVVTLILSAFAYGATFAIIGLAQIVWQRRQRISYLIPHPSSLTAK